MFKKKIKMTMNQIWKVFKNKFNIIYKDIFENRGYYIFDGSSEPAYKKYLISKDLAKPILRKLFQLGITPSKIEPGLDSVKKTCKLHYKLF